MDDCRKCTRPPGVVAFWMPKPGPTGRGRDPIGAGSELVRGSIPPGRW